MAGCKSLCAQFRLKRSSMDSIVIQGVPGEMPSNLEERGTEDVLRLGIIHSVGGHGEPDSEGWTEQFSMSGEVELTEADVILLRRMLDIWLGPDYEY